MSRIKWAYGITTVPQRNTDHFPRTLESLRQAGFDQPRLFIDGCYNPRDIIYNNYGLEITSHYPNIKPYGNWLLALLELYLRKPMVDRYAIFQDDFVTYKNLREYLESTPLPVNGYCNLYTFPHNYAIKPQGVDHGWYLSNQLGKGAVALVFSKDTVMRLLSAPSMIDRVQNTTRGHRSIDGAVVTALSLIGVSEYVHHPSLVQHTGIISSMGSKRHPLAPAFLGEDFDAREWIT